MSGEAATVRGRWRRVAPHLRLLPRVLGEVWRASRGWALLWIALVSLQGLLPVAVVTLTRGLVDALVPALAGRGAWESLRPVLLWAGALGGVMVLSELLRGVATWARVNQAERLQDHVTALIQQKSCTIDLAFYESPDYYDQLHRARLEARSRPLMLLEQLGGLLQQTLTLLALAALLLPYALWLPLVLLASTLPAFWVVLRYARALHRWRRSATPLQRRADYHDRLLSDAEAAAEVRLLSLGPGLIARYRRLRVLLRTEQLRLALEQNLAGVLAGVAALVVTAATVAWMGWRALQGQATLGDLVLFYQVFDRGQRGMTGVLRHLGQIYGNTLFLADLFAFLDLPDRVTDPPDPRPVPEPLRSGVAFEGVTFAYPGAERPVLRDFSLRVPAGKLVAVVGENGAGKSTLVKLICRFYDPQAGRVTLDGVDLRELSRQALWQRLGVLMQRAMRYHDTVSGNVAPALDEKQRSGAAEAVERALGQAGAAELVSALPAGRETLLGKGFEGGEELSGGQWRRLALARALFGEAPLLLLDEPTSGMDAWNERRWMDGLRALAAGRTTLLITHRFTTAMRADLILVMRAGQIVESGTHAELAAAADGPYARAWRQQVGDHLQGDG